VTIEASGWPGFNEFTISAGSTIRPAASGGCEVIRLAMVLLAAMTGASWAQIPPPGGPLTPPPSVLAPPSTAPSPGVMTSRGTGLVTGTSGSPQMVTIPGSAVPGTMFNNGNGTSTIMVPGGPSEVVPTPR
jgi:hypothetical protein